MTHKPGDLPRGFAYVEIDDAAVEAAVRALNGYEWQGRRLMVNEARERIDQD